MSTATVMDARTVAEHDDRAPQHRSDPDSRRRRRRAPQDVRHPSGFWLLASIGIAAVLATGAVIAFASDERADLRQLRRRHRRPDDVILPIVAILAVTSEWSQRSGLTTFTLVPHRGRVIRAKVVVPIAIGVGVDGAGVRHRRARQHRRRGASPASTPSGTSRSPILAYIVLADVLGHDGRLHARRADPQLRRRDRGVLRLLVRAADAVRWCWPPNQAWFRDLQPWVDFNFAQGELFDGGMTGEHWAHLGVDRRRLARPAAGRRPGAGDAVRGEVGPGALALLEARPRIRPPGPGRAVRPWGGGRGGGTIEVGGGRDVDPEARLSDLVSNHLRRLGGLRPVRGIPRARRADGRRLHRHRPRGLGRGSG